MPSTFASCKARHSTLMKRPAGSATVPAAAPSAPCPTTALSWPAAVCSTGLTWSVSSTFSTSTRSTALRGWKPTSSRWPACPTRRRAIPWWWPVAVLQVSRRPPSCRHGFGKSSVRTQRCVWSSSTAAPGWVLRWETASARPSNRLARRWGWSGCAVPQSLRLTRPVCCWTTASASTPVRWCGRWASRPTRSPNRSAASATAWGACTWMAT
ncbi:hypothetical protein D3C79_824940 [compost metagenome]